MSIEFETDEGTRVKITEEWIEINSGDYLIKPENWERFITQVNAGRDAFKMLKQ